MLFVFLGMNAVCSHARQAPVLMSLFWKDFIREIAPFLYIYLFVQLIQSNDTQEFKVTRSHAI